VVSGVAFADSWSEDFTVDPDTSATGQWIDTRTSRPDPVSGGALTWDGSGTGYALYDDKDDNPMNGDTTWTAGWLAAPQDAGAGVGLWFNFAQDGLVHGFGVNMYMMHGRNGTGPAIIFSAGGPTIQVAEGRVDIVASFSEETGLLIWEVTDSVETHSGSATIAFGATPSTQPAGISIAQNDIGAGSLDYITVTNNTCSDRSVADLTGDCLVTIEDFAVLAADWLDCGMRQISSCP
jgi:hypothetical protein